MKHALYEITKNIPPPAVTIRSKTNGITHLVRRMKKGESALIPFKQVNSARLAAKREGIALVWQRVGKGTTARIWHVGKAEATPEAKPTVYVQKVTSQGPAIKRKYTRRHANLTAKLPRAAGAPPLFTGPEKRPE